MKVKNIVILGSTGSIGINALKVIDRYSDRFKVVGLSAYNNFKLLEKQVRKFLPKYVAASEKGVGYLKKNVLSRNCKILDVNHDLDEIVTQKNVDVVVIGMRGSAALDPFISAVRCGKIVAPANKEAIVVAGDIINKEAKKHGASIIPIDSEQSAIFQCLQGRDRNQLEKVLLTASGGALLDVPKTRFRQLTVKEILNHPRWKMGKKITVDSATLLNKGFEVIEAIHLFNLTVDQIEVVVHPEAIIHSMVEFKDGSIIAQLGITDMRLPIQYALTYPQRWDTGLKRMSFSECNQLNFRKPDLKKFPLLALAFYVAKREGTYPSVMNAADEVAVDAFLENKIPFTDITRIVEKIVLKHNNTLKPNLKQIMEADRWSRDETRKVIESR